MAGIEGRWAGVERSAVHDGLGVLAPDDNLALYRLALYEMAYASMDASEHTRARMHAHAHGTRMRTRVPRSGRARW